GSHAETADAQPRKRNRALNAGMLQTDFGHTADDGFGSIERRRVGQLRERDQILLVLSRHETGRDLLETPAGKEHKTAIDHQGNGALAKNAADAGCISVAGPGE